MAFGFDQAVHLVENHWKLLYFVNHDDCIGLGMLLYDESWVHEQTTIDFSVQQIVDVRTWKLLPNKGGLSGGPGPKQKKRLHAQQVLEVQATASRDFGAAGGAPSSPLRRSKAIIDDTRIAGRRPSDDAAVRRVISGGKFVGPEGSLYDRQ